MRQRYIILAFFILISLGLLSSLVPPVQAQAGDSDPTKVKEATGGDKVGSKTDDKVVEREEQAIKLDGLNAAQVKELRDKAEKFAFQAEVDRMMKLIINSLYKNKEIFLRELISNASDALDKIRFMSLTNKEVLDATPELSIKIKADKEDKTLRVIDTGIGMTKEDLVKNLGTIAKSGTSEFLTKLSEVQSTTESSDLIGQFGVGFYSSFLVADRVTVITKHNDDKQYIWESDANSFSVTEDPRGNTLKRGTEIILHMKEEGLDWLEPSSLRDLIVKYSQFINFPIYVWESRTETVEEAQDKDEKKEKKDEDATVEEEKDKSEPKKVEKTVWDWRLVNENKPIWTRKPADIKDEEYNQFFKSFTKASEDPLAKSHFVAEGEVTFKSILFVPKTADFDAWSNYGKKTDNIKMYVRRVFITDNFEEMMPKYLSFIKGIVDSDDLPLNVSRETLQQHKLLKVIKKKLVRKALDMIKKIEPEQYKQFWKEYSTNIKVGIIDDAANRTRLSKLLLFWSSHDSKEQVSLADYVSRMKEKQDNIYFMSGQSRKEVENSPFVEKLLKRGYEVLYLLEPIDQYAIQSLPEFEGKKFQNAAKDGIQIGEETAEVKERKEALTKEFEPLTKWLQETALKDKIEKAQISDRLASSPCALVASQYGWDAAMDRVMRAQAYQKAQDPSQVHFSSQKKILEINPRHPLIKELKRRAADQPDDKSTAQLATILYEAATLRSGYVLEDSAGFAERIESMLRLSVGVPESEGVEEDIEDEPMPTPATSSKEGTSDEVKDEKSADDVKEEL
uniref:HATPase_c domain-containing protein n=1 Tax=Macrostomum lignano TaxID=282301 RepID=A0A1I8IB98_9PLAT